MSRQCDGRTIQKQNDETVHYVDIYIYIVNQLIFNAYDERLKTTDANFNVE